MGALKPILNGHRITIKNTTAWGYSCQKPLYIVVSGHLLRFALEGVGHPAPIACLDKPKGLLKRVPMPIVDFVPAFPNGRTP